jgi:hypothetical protein
MDQAVLAAFHPDAGPGLEVVESPEVQDAMHEVPGQFDGPGDAKLAGLENGLLRAKKNFAVEFECGIILAVVESDDVGGAVMGEPALVEFGHSPKREQVQAQGISGEAELLFEEVTRDVDQGLGSYGAKALAVADLDLVHGRFLPRCSS